MTGSCSVPDCVNVAKKVKLFHVPQYSENENPHSSDSKKSTYQLLQKRRRWMWIHNCSIPAKRAKNARVCGDHFVSGTPADRYDVNNVDWAPTQNLPSVSSEDQVTEQASPQIAGRRQAELCADSAEGGLPELGLSGFLELHADAAVGELSELDLCGLPELQDDAAEGELSELNLSGLPEQHIDAAEGRLPELDLSELPDLSGQIFDKDIFDAFGIDEEELPELTGELFGFENPIDGVQLEPASRNPIRSILRPINITDPPKDHRAPCRALFPKPAKPIARSSNPLRSIENIRLTNICNQQKQSAPLSGRVVGRAGIKPSVTPGQQREMKENPAETIEGSSNLSRKTTEEFRRGTITDLTPENVVLAQCLDAELRSLKDELNRSMEHEKEVLAKCSVLEKKLDIANEITRLSLSSLEHNDEKCRYFTGLNSGRVLKRLYDALLPDLPDCRALSKDQLLLMVLRKMRLNEPFCSLGYLYNLHQSTISEYFYQTINAIYPFMRELVRFPPREVLKMHMPAAFQRKYKDRVTVIIDCFEVHMEAPNPKEKTAIINVFSAYKKHDTIKVLIGISPSGGIIFISPAFGGRISDKEITKQSGFLDCLKEGDFVLADRGFLIDDLLITKNATVSYPAFKKKDNQLEPMDAIRSRELSSLRIHVERVIGSFRQKFMMLAELIPLYVLLHWNNEMPAIDQLFRIAAGLVNMCPSIVPM